MTNKTSGTDLGRRGARRRRRRRVSSLSLYIPVRGENSVTAFRGRAVVSRAVPPCETVNAKTAAAAAVTKWSGARVCVCVGGGEGESKN